MSVDSTEYCVVEASIMSCTFFSCCRHTINCILAVYEGYVLDCYLVAVNNAVLADVAHDIDCVPAAVKHNVV
jgi:hypothetical protein